MAQDVVLSHSCSIQRVLFGCSAGLNTLRLMVWSAIDTRKAATLGLLVVNLTIETMCFTYKSIRCAHTCCCCLP